MRRLLWPAAIVGLVAALLAAAVSLAVFTDRKTNPQTLKAASTWPTPTPTPTPTATPTPTPAPGTGLRAQYRNNTPTQPTDNAITPWLRIVNTTTKPIDLAPVKARYWFTKDSTSTPVISFCDYAYLDCTANGLVTHRIGAVSPARPGADTYVEVGFKGGTLTAKGTSGETTWDIQLRLHKQDYSNFDERNDYSWGTGPDFQDWPKVALYYSGAVVWGTPP